MQKSQLKVHCQDEHFSIVAYVFCVDVKYDDSFTTVLYKSLDQNIAIRFLLLVIY